jgi:uncharacterized membrane protein
MTSEKPDSAQLIMNGTLRDNIAALTRHQREDAERASFSERLAEAITRFTGSMTFVLLHLVLYGSWIAINLGWLPIVEPFDPTFVVLAMEASVEAIFLSTFVLISQNRMARDSRRRADLDLHVSLLTEHELTKLVAVVDQIARKLDVPLDDPELPEIERDVEPVAVLNALEDEREREGLQD